MDDDLSELPEAERALIGTIVHGRVVDVQRWGVLVDVNLSQLGFIDPLYIDDDCHYEAGQDVEAYLSSYQARTRKYWLRPLGQVPIAERYT
jgi:ribosomal protein S1